MSEAPLGADDSENEESGLKELGETAALSVGAIVFGVFTIYIGTTPFSTVIGTFLTFIGVLYFGYTAFIGSIFALVYTLDTND